MTVMRLWLVLPLFAAACHARADHAEASGGSADAAVPATPTNRAATPVADLSGYAGRYPFDAVGGVRFLDQPAVRAAVARATPDTAVRQAVLDGGGPQTPIVRRGSRLLSWGCQAHDCGDHNWTLLVGRDGRGGEICYHDADGAGTRWYKDGRVEAGRSDDCPSGDGR